MGKIMAQMLQSPQYMSTSTNHRDLAHRLPVIIVGLAAAALALPCYSQTTSIPLPGLGQGAGSVGVTNATEDLKNSAHCSRFTLPEDRPGFISKKLSVLSIASREIDPFGQVQDPNSKPAIIKPTITNRRPTTLKRTSFTDIVDRIKINTIMPSEKRFLIDTRSFKIGDQIPVMYRGRKTMVEVVGVTSSRVDFKNTESGEVASVKLSLIPAGMKTGSGAFSAPGMVTDKADAPLQLDPLNNN